MYSKNPNFDGAIYIPSCIVGKGNCLPEDCGGIWGYEDLKKIISNPNDEQFDETMEWLGAEFDPDYFDKKEINEMLKEVDFGCIWLE